MTAGTATADVNPACGQTITSDTTLTADLGPCGDNGLVVGADDIVLDLAGYRIFGTPSPFDKAGVYVMGRSRVTVRNGTVSDFDAGVVIEGGGNNTVTGIVAERNIGGRTASGSTRFGDGFAIESSSDNRIVGNTARDNGPFSGIGIYSLVDGDHPRSTSGPSLRNLIQGNQVLANVIGRDGSTRNTDNDGIRIENTYAAGAAPIDANNQIIGNQVSGSGLDGIANFARSSGNVIRGNQVTRNGLFRSTARRGDGIVVFNFSDRAVIENNFVSGNGDNGIRIRGPFRAFPGSTNNRIVGNSSVGNAVLPTIPSPVFGTAAFDLNDQNPNCDNNLWSANRFRTADPACTTTGGQQV